LHTAAADEKETGHGVCDADGRTLERVCEGDGGDGGKLSQRIPDGFVRPVVVPHVSNIGRHGAPGGVAAGDGDVASVFNGGDEGRKQFGRVLEVGVHDTEDGGASLLPAMEDGAGEAALAFAYEEPDARVFLRDGGDEFRGAVAAVVIDDENFVIGAGGVERCRDAGEQRGQAAGFAKGGDDERN